MTIFFVVALAILTAILYRMGGSDEYPKAVRRFGCPITVLASLYILGIHGPWWAYLVSYLALYGALTTYHDYLTDDGSENWICWLMTGLVYGLAMFPFFALWKMVLARSLVLAVFTCIWSEGQSDPVWEELGRGFLLGITIPILIIS